MTADNLQTFGDWLLEQLKEHDINQSELARRAGLSRVAISDYISGKRKNPDPLALKSIAKALKLPVQVVFRQAGYIPDRLDPREIAVEVLGYKLDELTQRQLEEIIQYIEFIQDRDHHPDRRTSYRKHRQGEAPAETVKGDS